MFLYNELMMLMLMMSMMMGMSLQNMMVNDMSELKWINNYNLDNFIMMIITLFYNNIMLMLGLFSFMLASSTNINKMLMMHWMIIMMNTMYLNNNMNNNLMNIMFMMMCMDVMSVMNIMFIQSGEGIWYYFLYQSIMTMLMWWVMIIDNIYMLGLLYYYKLGSGIGGYYMPNLYYNIMNYNLNLMMYIGITNIMLMYNPMFLLSNYNEFMYMMIISNLLMMIYILYMWIYNGYIFMNNWLYCISFSTIIISNMFFMFISFSMTYNLYYYMYYFTITSIMMWFIFIGSLFFILF